ncbi:hypothetical protein M5D96_012408 [Drosophila gunungcola]|uniref:Uncharacterized protein n=1 Tax=Drosophila gunungcola TaxID=103775 RepID=A0A9Q0BKH1_9MUSC|nr:hypothetical protein M5D96_012408 [Drosophila gunungcola]
MDSLLLRSTIKYYDYTHTHTHTVFRVDIFLGQRRKQNATRSGRQDQLT